MADTVECKSTYKMLPSCIGLGETCPVCDNHLSRFLFCFKKLDEAMLLQRQSIELLLVLGSLHTQVLRGGQIMEVRDGLCLLGYQSKHCQVGI